MNDFRMKKLVLGVIRTNCYIINNAQTKEAIVIDPADQAEKIEQYLKENDLVCKGILLTHGHFDHIMAADKLSKSMGASIYAHETEAVLLKDPNLNASAQFGQQYSLEADVLLKDQEMLRLAGFDIKIIHVPGHTAGGACYYFHEYGVLISGDVLFRESVGRSDFPTGNGKLLVASILDKLMVLNDQVSVYPGHGEATTIGYERDHNVYL